MYETIKELHIEIEQRIQQITSNRYGSMPPQFYDMMLNRTAIKYIQSKSNRKTNYKGEGFEDSMKRVEDFQSLKRETTWLPVIKNVEDIGRGFITIPSNCLKFITSTSKLNYDKTKTPIIELKPETSYRDFKNLYYCIISLSAFEASDTWWLINDYFNNGIDTEFDVTNYNRPSSALGVEYPKYMVDWLYHFLNEGYDDVKKLGNYNVYYEHFLDRYYKDCIIITSDVLFGFKREHPQGGSGQNRWIEIPTYNLTNMTFKPYNSNYIYSENDLIASENIRATLNNPYSKKNRHLNPITELINNKLYVYQGKDFCVSEIKITYLKKPRLFSSDLNQMSDMTITPEFVDMVVSDILLILKDNTFNLVKQQTNIE